MTEAQWLACTNPLALLRFLPATGGAMPRKLRLFTIACCRRAAFRQLDELGQFVLASLEDFAADMYGLRGAGYFDAQCQPVLDVAERYADGLATEQELQGASGIAAQENEKAGRLLQHTMMAQANHWVMFAANAATAVTAAAYHAATPEVNAEKAIVAAAAFIGYVAGAWAAKQTDSATAGKEAMDAAEIAERGVQCGLFRDVFGNLFWSHDPDLACRTPPVASLAQVIYDGRTFDRLVELSGVLDEAGCIDPVIVSHCRAPGPHVRGCWVLDLILSKDR
jgi:hypothetical protein